MRNFVFVIDEAGDIHFACVNADVKISKVFSRFIESEFYHVYVIRHSGQVESTIGALLSGDTQAAYCVGQDLALSDAPRVNEAFLQMHRTTHRDKVFCSFSYGGLPKENNALHDAFYAWIKINASMI